MAENKKSVRKAKVARAALDLVGEGGARRLIEEAFDVLARTGVEIHDEETVKRLSDAGAEVGKDRRVRIPAACVERALATVPSQFMLFDRAGNEAFLLGDGIVRFNPGSAAVHILDGNTIRRPATRDVVRFAALTDALDPIDAQSTGLVAGDVPASIADRYRLYIGLVCCRKPMITGTFAEEGFAPMAEMLEAVAGSAEALRARPLAIFDVCPSAPLRWSHLGCRSLAECATRGIPAQLISMPLAGATAPASLAGSLVQHAAESLSGIVIHQTARPGSPIVFGGSPAVFDLKAGTTPMGSPETLLLDIGFVRVGRALKLPTQAYMGMSDAKCLDVQCGFESALGTLMAVLAKVDLVSGPGMLDFESCQSLEKLVIDAEVCEGARTLARGISVSRKRPLALELFEDLADPNVFLLADTTLRRAQEAAGRPPHLADRHRREQWLELGGRPLEERARERVERLLREHKPEPPPEALHRQLRAIMEREARAHGLDRLPEGAP
jgi:trimethylamine---corrinoid protein Co-methyltransferase